MAHQVEAYGNQAKAEIAGQQKALQAEGAAASAADRHPGADAKAKKIEDFEAKQNGLQAAAQKKEQMIQGGFLKAQQTIAQTLEPILQTLMQQRGANMILDKNAVVYASPQAVSAFDITHAGDRAVEPETAGLEGRAGCAAARRRGRAAARSNSDSREGSPWPILASTTIAVLSRWPRSAQRAGAALPAGADGDAR